MDLHDQETVSLSRAGTVGVATPPAVQVPRRLGSVQLVREIGQGGMGVVWLGRDEMLGREVAVKFLLGAVSSEEDPSFATFLEGARAAAKLRTPGITAIHHADVVEGAPYIVMEYIDGPTLARVTHSNGGLSLPAAWSVMQHLCDTTAVLHDAGIIHRDIKPSNVMLDTQSRLFLTDFGVALLRPDMGERFHERANLAGTPAYMAPEMFECFASARTDTYALGMVFYELLAGRTAFAADSLEEMRRLHREAEPDMSVLAAKGVEPGVIELIERALRKDPKFRFRSGRHMLEAMERTRVSAPVRVRGDSELAAAALRCRTRAEEGGDATPSDPQQHTLYDHMATLAARKRANPQTPPVRVPEDSTYHDRTTQSDAPLGITPEAAGGVKSGAAASTEHTPERHPYSLHLEDDDAPIKPATVAWIGLAIFAVLAIVVVIWLLVSGSTAG
jgi:serine/threonine protein kinase